MSETGIFERKQRVTETSKETMAEIVNNSVQALSRSPAKSVAEMQKQFVQPVVNADGKPSAIGEINRIVAEAEKALDEIAQYVGLYDSRILVIKEAISKMQTAVDTSLATQAKTIPGAINENKKAIDDLYQKLPKVIYYGEE